MRRLILTAALLAAGAPLHAQRADSAAFIIRLGKDTTVIERYIRTANQLVVEAVQRSPRTTLHRLVLDLTPDGSVARGAYTMRPPQGGANISERTITAGPGLIPVAGPFYTPYELAMMQAAKTKAARTVVNIRTANDTVQIPFGRIGTDTLTLTNQFGEPMRAHVDASGRLLHLNTPAYVTVERVKWVDLEAYTREFAARDTTGKGLGPLSPRYAARQRVGNANVWTDYSRPGARGRPIWGGLVPYGRVWRMGANEAAHFAVDRTVQLGDLTVEPGTYTLNLLPTSANDWTLIVNRRTGISGLDYDAKEDVGRVKMNVQPTTAPVEAFTIGVNRDGAFEVAWGNMRGTVPIAVK